MKLYATVTSERESRMVNKGGNDFVRVTFSHKGRFVAIVELRETLETPMLTLHTKAENGEIGLVDVKQLI